MASKLKTTPRNKPGVVVTVAQEEEESVLEVSIPQAPSFPRQDAGHMALRPTIKGWKSVLVEKELPKESQSWWILSFDASENWLIRWNLVFSIAGLGALSSLATALVWILQGKEVLQGPVFGHLIIVCIYLFIFLSGLYLTHMGETKTLMIEDLYQHWMARRNAKGLGMMAWCVTVFGLIVYVGFPPHSHNSHAYLPVLNLAIWVVIALHSAWHLVWRQRKRKGSVEAPPLSTYESFADAWLRIGVIWIITGLMLDYVFHPCDLNIVPFPWALLTGLCILSSIGSHSFQRSWWSYTGAMLVVGIGLGFACSNSWVVVWHSLESAIIVFPMFCLVSYERERISRRAFIKALKLREVGIVFSKPFGEEEDLTVKAAIALEKESSFRVHPGHFSGGFRPKNPLWFSLPPSSNRTQPSRSEVATGGLHVPPRRPQRKKKKKKQDKEVEEPALEGFSKPESVLACCMVASTTVAIAASVGHMQKKDPRPEIAGRILSSLLSKDLQTIWESGDQSDGAEQLPWYNTIYVFFVKVVEDIKQLLTLVQPLNEELQLSYRKDRSRAQNKFVGSRVMLMVLSDVLLTGIDVMMQMLNVYPFEIAARTYAVRLGLIAPLGIIVSFGLWYALRLKKRPVWIKSIVVFYLVSNALAFCCMSLLYVNPLEKFSLWRIRNTLYRLQVHAVISLDLPMKLGLITSGVVGGIHVGLLLLIGYPRLAPGVYSVVIILCGMVVVGSSLERLQRDMFILQRMCRLLSMKKRPGRRRKDSVTVVAIPHSIDLPIVES